MTISETGFEPAISRIVAERVIRCATRIKWNLSVISKFIFHKNKKPKGEKASLQSWKDLAPHFTLAERSEIAAKSSERGASINAFYSRLITRNVCHSLWKKSSKQLIGVSSRSLNGSKKKKFCHERSIRREILFSPSLPAKIVKLWSFQLKVRVHFVYTMRKNLPKTLDQLIFCKYTLVFSKCSQIY